MKKIVLCGGGTAGHIIPNLALLPLLVEIFDEIHYIGSKGGLERELINTPLIKYHEISCEKFRRSRSLKSIAQNASLPFKLAKSVREAKKLLKDIKPNVIFSKGGFAALPVVLASGKTPVVAHESDLKLGLANKLSKNKCRYILTTFEQTAKKLKGKGIFCGSPLKNEIFKGDANRVLKECGFSAVKPVLLVMGGSMGAASLNACLYESLDSLTKSFNILHLTGKKHFDSAPKASESYRPFAFRSDMGNIYAAADLVLTRGGSNVLSEVIALKKPALVVPLPKSASRGDQIDNAMYYSERGYVMMLTQQQLNKQTLYEKLLDLEKNKLKLINKMTLSPITQGNQKIVEIITSTKNSRNNN